MATGTLIMLILLGLGAIALIVALVILGRTLYRLFRTAQGIQQHLDSEVRVLMTKQEQAMTSANAISANQVQVQASIERFKQALARLSYLVGQYGEARKRLLGLD